LLEWTRWTDDYKSLKIKLKPIAII